MGSDEAGQQAMSAERLAVIRAMIALTDVGDAQLSAITELLTEVERLRAREAALVAEREQAMAIVRAVADATGCYIGDHLRQCEFCDHAALESRIIYHEDDCPVEQARALLASAGEQAAQMESAPHCDYCSQPWAVQAWRVNMQVREWLCAAHFDDLSSDRLYRVERDRRSEQEEVLYSDEEAEAAYHSYEDDVAQGEAQGEGTSDDE